MSAVLPQSGIYRGVVSHCRLTPKQHQFSYRVFMMLLELGREQQLFAGTPLWSAKKPALAWLRRRDFIGPEQLNIADAVKQRIKEETGIEFTGRIFMLANLRYFGFIMNPIVCYYCYDDNQQLRFVVAEVTNTPWRERHSYVLNCDPNQKVLRTQFSKAMHVSPFNHMDLQYVWRSNSPAEQLRIGLDASENGATIFKASLRLRFEPMSGKALTKLILMYPFMTLKVGLAIYWQALRLYVKGVPIVSHPKNDSKNNETIIPHTKAVKFK